MASQKQIKQGRNSIIMTALLIERKMQSSLDCVYQLAKQDDRVVFIGSDLGPGVLDEMRTEFGERFHGRCRRATL